MVILVKMCFSLKGKTNIKFENKNQTWVMEKLRNKTLENIGTCDKCKSPFGSNRWKMPNECDKESSLKLTKVH